MNTAPLATGEKSVETVDLRRLWQAEETPVLLGHAPKEVDDGIGLRLKRGTEIVASEQHWLVREFLPDDSLIIVAGHGRNRRSLFRRQRGQQA